MSAVTSLVLARLRRRAGQAVLVAAAVAAAVGLIGTMFGISSVSGDLALRRSLAALDPGQRAVRISLYAPSARDAASMDRDARAAAEAIGALAPDVVPGMLMRQLRERIARIEVRLVALDDPGRWTELLEGRQPAPCDGRNCEALLLAERPLDPALLPSPEIGGLQLDVVGRGLLRDAVPLGALDQSGPMPGAPTPIGWAELPSSALLLVNGVQAAASAAGPEGIPRTYFWTSPLAVDRIHPWTAAPLHDAVAELQRRAAASGEGFSVEGPLGAVDAELFRIRAAGSRLLLIGSLAAAVLLAFAAFAALVARQDVGLELGRLAAAGASRRQRAAFLLLEAAVPAVIGGMAGIVVALMAVASLAAWQGVPAAAALTDSVLTPAGLLVVVLVTVAAIAAILLGSLPAPGRRVAAALPVVALTALVVLGWQLLAGGALDPERLASTIASPLIVLLPPALAFVVAAAFLLLLPPLFRWLARRLAGVPLPLRLSLLSVARDPERPSATLALLAFSLGTIVFAAGYAASLRQGIADQAAFQAAMDLRVQEQPTRLSFSPSVVPVDRYASLPPDVERYPVVRAFGELPIGGRVELLGVPPEAPARMLGWRSDFSRLTADEVGRRIALPGDWQLRGEPLLEEMTVRRPSRYDPSIDRAVALEVELEGDPVRITAVVETPRGDFTSLIFGRLAAGRQTVYAPIADAAIGGTIVGLGVGRDSQATGMHGAATQEKQRAMLRIPALAGLIGEGPIDVELSNFRPQVLVRPAQPTDGVALPAIVSPALAATAVDDRITVRVGEEATIQLRVIGEAEHLPTVVDQPTYFAMAAIEPLAAAINADLPGSAYPTEMWIRTPDPARTAEVSATLAQPPFRSPHIVARSAIEAERSGDPLAAAIIWALVLAAAAGLALALGGIVVGALADLRDERGELADLEAQGMTTRALRQHALARTAWLVGGGILAGLAAGLLLVQILTGVLALTAAAALPLPPLVAVYPWTLILAVVAGLLLAIAATAGLLARRAFRRARLASERSRV
jgi:hypothetical protein